MCVPLESNPQPFTQRSTTEPQEHQSLSMLKTVLLLYIFVETFFLDSLMNIKFKQNLFAILIFYDIQ